MELFQLKYFVNIADTLSFSRSAELLHVSQPALSHQMQQLERELGTKLFDREHRKIKLTPSGEVFLPLAQAVLFRADEAIRVLKEHMGVEAGEVRMGCNPSVATYVAPRLLASFRATFPRVTVELVEGGDADLARMVLEGSIDFAVVTASGSPTTLDTTFLTTEELLVVVPPGHRLAGRRSVALPELSHEAFLFPSESFNVTVQVMEACRSAGFEPQVPVPDRLGGVGEELRAAGPGHLGPAGHDAGRGERRRSGDPQGGGRHEPGPQPHPGQGPLAHGRRPGRSCCT